MSARAWIATLRWPALLFLAVGCAHPLPATGLHPLPVLMGGFWTRDPITRQVDSLQPTLRWEAFPRPEDLTADTEGRLANARSVTYELRIWRAEGESPGELVYVRAGLAEPVHTLDTPLLPDALYLWTVRARFDLEGQPRVTPWAVLMRTRSDARGAVLPPSAYYQLRTPTQAKPGARISPG
jgi:hypothetical protein